MKSVPNENLEIILGAAFFASEQTKSSQLKETEVVYSPKKLNFEGKYIRTLSPGKDIIIRIRVSNWA
jgi:hypothetical protein